MRSIIIIIFLTSCTSKYSKDKYLIPNTYRDLISSFHTGDTLKFYDGKRNQDFYLISKIDSSFIDEGKGLMKVRGRKDIVVYCRELTNPQQRITEYSMIILNRYPDLDLATFDFRIKDFYSIDNTTPFVLRTDTIRVNGLIFSNYYLFDQSKDTQENKQNSISEIYITKEKGIVAYRDLSGTWWTKSN